MARSKIIFFLILILAAFCPLGASYAKLAGATEAEIEDTVVQFFETQAPVYGYEITGVAVRTDESRPVFRYLPKKAPQAKPFVYDFYGSSGAEDWMANKFWRIYDCPPDVINMKGYARVKVPGKSMTFKCWVDAEGSAVLGPKMAAMILKNMSGKKFATKVPFMGSTIYLQYDLDPEYDDKAKEYFFNSMGWKEKDGARIFTVYQVKIGSRTGSVSQAKEHGIAFPPQSAFEKIYQRAMQNIRSIHPDYKLSFINWDYDDNLYKLMIDYRPEAKTIDHWRVFFNIDATSGEVVSSWHGLYLSSNHIQYMRGKK